MLQRGAHRDMPFVVDQCGNGGMQRLHMGAVGQRMMQCVAQTPAAHAGGAGVEQRQQRRRRFAADGFGEFEVAPGRRVHAQPRAFGFDDQRTHMGDGGALG